MQLKEGPVLLVAAVSRLDQHVTHVSGCSSWGNPQRPAVAVLSVHLDQLQRQANIHTQHFLWLSFVVQQPFNAFAYSGI